jgi:hypothetical protein
MGRGGLVEQVFALTPNDLARLTGADFVDVAQIPLPGGD